MPVNIIDTLKPKNGLNFPVVEAIDVFVEDYENLADAISHFATDAMIEAINIVLSGKANTSDVNTATTSLQAQIDQIAQAAGTGTADTEIAHARVGVDGTSYQTLKGRLDAEYDALTAEQTNLKEDLTDLTISTNFDLSTEQTINGSVAPNGKWYSSVSNKNQSKCIENDEYLKITIKASESTNAYVSFCKYDSTPVPSDGAVVVFASGETARHEISVGETEKFNIPSDCTHIIIMSRWDSSVDNLPESVQIERDNERIRMLETKISASAINVTHTPQFMDGFYYEIRDHEGGRKVANSGYSCTDYINVLGGKSVTVRTYLKAGDFQMGVGFYDIEKKFISGVHIYGTPYYTDPAEETISIPEKAVYMTYTIVNGSAYKSDSRYIVNQTNSAFGESFRDLLATVAKDIPNYLCSAEKILCIGDSLTAGSYYFADSSNVVTKKTYPKMLSRMTGVDVTNGGAGGATVRGWMSLKRPLFNFSEFDTFIVWLGTNAGLTDTLDTDVLPYESYEDYADTQTGQYCRLIEEINNDTGGDCLIAICNVFASSGDVITTNAVLFDIYDMYVQKGYKMILIDMSDLTQQNALALHHYIYNNHFGIAGNCYVANRVMKSISTAISNNTRLSEYNIEVDSLG